MSRQAVLDDFDPDFILGDDLFEGRVHDMSVVEVQSFLEHTPYESRAWLADHELDGKSVAQIIVDESTRHDINPLMILVRLQAEQGLISDTEQPSQDKLDAAMGCDCRDNHPCSDEHQGLHNQIRCGARYLRENFTRSQQRTEGYRTRGTSSETLDGHVITPSNHATAALYNYTPWRGSSDDHVGAWLTWSIASRFLGHLKTRP